MSTEREDVCKSASWKQCRQPSGVTIPLLHAWEQPTLRSDDNTSNCSERRRPCWSPDRTPKSSSGGSSAGGDLQADDRSRVVAGPLRHSRGSPSPRQPFPSGAHSSLHRAVPSSAPAHTLAPTQMPLAPAALPTAGPVSPPGRCAGSASVVATQSANASLLLLSPASSSISSQQFHASSAGWAAAREVPWDILAPTAASSAGFLRRRQSSDCGATATTGPVPSSGIYLRPVAQVSHLPSAATAVDTVSQPSVIITAGPHASQGLSLKSGSASISSSSAVATSIYGYGDSLGAAPLHLPASANATHAALVPPRTEQRTPPPPGPCCSTLIASTIPNGNSTVSTAEAAAASRTVGCNSSFFCAEATACCGDAGPAQATFRFHAAPCQRPTQHPPSHPYSAPTSPVAAKAPSGSATGPAGCRRLGASQGVAHAGGTGGGAFSAVAGAVWSFLPVPAAALAFTALAVAFLGYGRGDTAALLPGVQVIVLTSWLQCCWAFMSRQDPRATSAGRRTLLRLAQLTAASLGVLMLLPWGGAYGRELLTVAMDEADGALDLAGLAGLLGQYFSWIWVRPYSRTAPTVGSAAAGGHRSEEHGALGGGHGGDRMFETIADAEFRHTQAHLQAALAALVGLWLLQAAVATTAATPTAARQHQPTATGAAAAVGTTLDATEPDNVPNNKSHLDLPSLDLHGYNAKATAPLAKGYDYRYDKISAPPLVPGALDAAGHPCGVDEVGIREPLRTLTAAAEPALLYVLKARLAPQGRVAALVWLAAQRLLLAGACAAQCAAAVAIMAVWALAVPRLERLQFKSVGSAAGVVSVAPEPSAGPPHIPYDHPVLTSWVSVMLLTAALAAPLPLPALLRSAASASIAAAAATVPAAPPLRHHASYGNRLAVCVATSFAVICSRLRGCFSLHHTALLLRPAAGPSRTLGLLLLDANAAKILTGVAVGLLFGSPAAGAYTWQLLQVVTVMYGMMVLYGEGLRRAAILRAHKWAAAVGAGAAAAEESNKALGISYVHGKAARPGAGVGSVGFTDGGDGVMSATSVCFSPAACNGSGGAATATSDGWEVTPPPPRQLSAEPAAPPSCSLTINEAPECFLTKPSKEDGTGDGYGLPTTRSILGGGATGAGVLGGGLGHACTAAIAAGGNDYPCVSHSGFSRSSAGTLSPSSSGRSLVSGEYPTCAVGRTADSMCGANPSEGAASCVAPKPSLLAAAAAARGTDIPSGVHAAVGPHHHFQHPHQLLHHHHQYKPELVGTVCGHMAPISSGCNHGRPHAPSSRLAVESNGGDGGGGVKHTPARVHHNSSAAGRPSEDPPSTSPSYAASSAVLRLIVYLALLPLRTLVHCALLARLLALRAAGYLLLAIQPWSLLTGSACLLVALLWVALIAPPLALLGDGPSQLFEGLLQTDPGALCVLGVLSATSLALAAAAVCLAWCGVSGELKRRWQSDPVERRRLQCLAWSCGPPLVVALTSALSWALGEQHNACAYVAAEAMRLAALWPLVWLQEPWLLAGAAAVGGCVQHAGCGVTCAVLRWCGVRPGGAARPPTVAAAAAAAAGGGGRDTSIPGQFAGLGAWMASGRRVGGGVSGGRCDGVVVEREGGEAAGMGTGMGMGIGVARGPSGRARGGYSALKVEVN